MKHINLETFANGAFSAQVNRAIEEVTKNIQDPNTEATATRKITVTIGFKPNQDRNLAPVGVQAKTTLAPALGVVTALQMGKDLKTGEVAAIEIGNQIPGQMSVADVPGVIPATETFDPDTGDMIKEALQYITGLKEESMEPKVITINGETYCDKSLVRYHSFPMACELRVNTLTALVDYIKGKPEELRDSMILHVLSPTRVQLITGLIDERKRETLMETNAIVNEFSFDHYYDQERFLIELQANFIETEDLKKIKMVAGNIQQGTTANYDDDGVSQKTTIKSGIANNTDVIVPNPVTLRPYRTFAEIEQPESEYVFRIKDSDRGPAFKLVEADGGLWKKEAMNRIKHYLEYELSVEIEKHNITIIA